MKLCSVYTPRFSKFCPSLARRGFGLVLTGLAIVDASSAPIAKSAITSAIMQALAQSPLILLLLGILLALTFVSSIPAIGIVMVLASSNALPMSAALAVTLGANIGTTLTPLMTAINRGNAIGKQLALIYTGTRVVGSIVVLLILEPLASLLNQFLPNPSTQVAFAHLAFNVTLAIAFIPFAHQLANLATRLLPEPKPKPKDKKPQELLYLDPNVLALPAVALGQAMRETLRMADLAAEMLQVSIRAFEESVSDLPKRIGALDDRLDDIESAIKRYLIQIDNASLTEEQVDREVLLLHISTELEAIGDIVDRQLMRLARRKQRKKVVFSAEEWEDIVTYHSEVVALLERAVVALAVQDHAIASEVLTRRQWLNQSKREIQLRHLRNLSSGSPDSLNASSIHLEIVNAMSRVLSHTCNIARAVQGEHLKDSYNT